MARSAMRAFSISAEKAGPARGDWAGLALSPALRRWYFPPLRLEPANDPLGQVAEPHKVALSSVIGAAGTMAAEGPGDDEKSRQSHDDLRQ